MKLVPANKMNCYYGGATSGDYTLSEIDSLKNDIAQAKKAENDPWALLKTAFITETGSIILRQFRSIDYRVRSVIDRTMTFYLWSSYAVEKGQAIAHRKTLEATYARLTG